MKKAVLYSFFAVLTLLALSGCVSVESLIKEGNYIEAEEVIASKKGTDRQSGYLALGDAYFSAGDYAMAGEYYIKAGSGDALEKMASFYMAENDLASAGKFSALSLSAYVETGLSTDTIYRLFNIASDPAMSEAVAAALSEASLPEVLFGEAVYKENWSKTYTTTDSAPGVIQSGNDLYFILFSDLAKYDQRSGALRWSRSAKANGFTPISRFIVTPEYALYALEYLRYNGSLYNWIALDIEKGKEQWILATENSYLPMAVSPGSNPVMFDRNESALVVLDSASGKDLETVDISMLKTTFINDISFKDYTLIDKKRPLYLLRYTAAFSGVSNGVKAQINLHQVFRAVDPNEKKVLWSKSFLSTEDVRLVAYDEKSVVFLSNDKETKIRMLIALDPSTGRQLWEKTVAFPEPYSVIVVSSGLNPGIVGIGTQAGTEAGTFIALDGATGRVVLSTQVPELKEYYESVTHPSWIASRLNLVQYNDTVALVIDYKDVIFLNKKSGEIINSLNFGLDSEQFLKLNAFEVHDGLLYILVNRYLYVLDAKSGIVLSKFDCLKDLFKGYSDVPAYFSMELTPNNLLVFGYQKGKGPRGINIGIAKALSRPVMSEAILSLPPAMNQTLFSLLGNKDAVVRKYAVVALGNNTENPEDLAALRGYMAKEKDKAVLAVYEQVLAR